MQILESRAAHVRLVATIAFRAALKRQVTPYKLLNLTRNLGHAILRQPAVARLPSMLQIDINNICNLRCPGCTTGLGEHLKAAGEMSYDAFCGIIDEVKDYVFLIVLYNSGEPFMHKDATRMISYANSKGISMLTSTNGSFFHTNENAERVVRSGLDMMIVSISGVSQGIHERYHKNGDIDRVITGVKNVIRARKALKSKTPVVILRYLLFDYNQVELDKAKALGRELGVEYFNIRPAATGEDYLGLRAVLASQEQRAESPPIPNHCYWLWSLPLIQHDGDLKPCCLLNRILDPPDQGNVFRDGGVAKVWHGDTFQGFRRQMLTDKSKIASCRNCKSFPGMQDHYIRKLLRRGDQH